MKHRLLSLSVCHVLAELTVILSVLCLCMLAVAVKIVIIVIFALPVGLCFRLS